MIPICRRLPNLSDFDALTALKDEGKAGSIQTITRIGDAEAPNTIAAAVYSGYRAGVELGQTVDLARVFGRREHPKA